MPHRLLLPSSISTVVIAKPTSPYTLGRVVVLSPPPFVSNATGRRAPFTHEESESGTNQTFETEGGILSFTCRPNSSGLTSFSVAVSRISKWRCGPPLLPELPDSPTTSPLATGSSPFSGNRSTLNDSRSYCWFLTYSSILAD